MDEIQGGASSITLFKFALIFIMKKEVFLFFNVY